MKNEKTSPVMLLVLLALGFLLSSCAGLGRETTIPAIDADRNKPVVRDEGNFADNNNGIRFTTGKGSLLYTVPYMTFLSETGSIGIGYLQAGNKFFLLRENDADFNEIQKELWKREISDLMKKSVPYPCTFDSRNQQAKVEFDKMYYRNELLKQYYSSLPHIIPH